VFDAATGQRVADTSTQWSSDRADVCPVSPDGVVTAVRPRLTTITATNGAQTATISIEVVVAFSGEWAGQIRLVSTRRVSGSGPINSTPPGPYPYALSISQVHGRITARDTRNPEVVLELVGSIDHEGRVSLSGTEDIPGEDAFHLVTDPWVVNLGSYR